MAANTEYRPGDIVPERGIYSIFRGHICLGETRFAPYAEFPSHASGAVTYRFQRAA